MPSGLKKAATKRSAPQKLKSSPVPYYVQVREALRKQILDGVLQPHQQMPSEHQMIEMFGVSRITIRQALAELENESLIFRVHGKGTFVSKPKAFQDITQLRSFGEAMQPLGYETFSKVISVKEVRASTVASEKLALEAGARVVEIKRLRYLNRDPVSVESSYLALELGRALARNDLSNRDIFLVLENELGVQLGSADLEVGAHLADELQAHLLGVEEASPLLHIERLTLSHAGTPIIFEYLYHRGDAFRYTVRVERAKER